MSDKIDYRLIHIQHERCQEYAASTYVLAPVEWSYSQIDKAIYNAQQEYYKAVELAKQHQKVPQPPYGLPSVAIFKKYPEKTVQEVLDMLEEQRVAYKSWEDNYGVTKTPFINFLVKQGFETLYEANAKMVCNWGHKHGTRIEYSETVEDTMPLPIKVVDPEFEDDSY